MNLKYFPSQLVMKMYLCISKFVVWSKRNKNTTRNNETIVINNNNNYSIISWKHEIVLTDHLQVSLSTSHRVRVDLTHVPSPIFLVHISDVQIPWPMIVIGKSYPRILGNNVVVNRQNRLSVHTDPSNLW